MEERLSQVETILFDGKNQWTKKSNNSTIESTLRSIQQKLFDIEHKIENWTLFWNQHQTQEKENKSLGSIPPVLQKELLLSYDEIELERMVKEWQELMRQRESLNNTSGFEAMDDTTLESKLSQLESKQEEMSSQAMQFHRRLIEIMKHYAAVIGKFNDIPMQP